MKLKYILMEKITGTQTEQVQFFDKFYVYKTRRSGHSAEHRTTYGSLQTSKRNCMKRFETEGYKIVEC